MAAVWLGPDLLLVLGLVMYEELQLLRCHWHFCHHRSWTSAKHYCGKLKSVIRATNVKLFSAFYILWISNHYTVFPGNEKEVTTNKQVDLANKTFRRPQVWETDLYKVCM